MAQQDSIVSISPELSNVATVKGDTLQKWEFHATMGGSVVAGGLGSASVFTVSPSLVWRPSERLTVKASATGFDSYALPGSGSPLRGREPRSLAPVRDRSSIAGSVSVSAAYQLSKRLWIAASFSHLGGEVATGAILNPWMATASPLALDANVYSASLHYRLGEKSFIDVHFTHIDDRAGTLAPLVYDACYAAPFHYGTPFGVEGFHTYHPLFDSQW